MKILQFFLCTWIVGANEIYPPLSERIVAGRNCDSAEYPYLAAIASGSETFCGGSFVTPEWVLTAAHCCNLMNNVRRYTVVAGQSRWMQDAEDSSPVEAVFPHREYNDYPITSDICLVKLKKSVTPSSKVKMSKLATTADYEEFIKNDKCNRALIIGFGDQDQRLYNGKRQADKRERTKRAFDPQAKCGNMPVLPRSKCNDDPRLGSVIRNDVFCMQHDTQRDLDTCQGDSGGPVYCQNLQIGVVSAGYGCGDPRFPGLYIRVDQHKDYIERQIQMQERNMMVDMIRKVDETNSTGNATNAGTSAPVGSTTKGSSAAIRYKGSFHIFVISAVIINIVAIF